MTIFASGCIPLLNNPDPPAEWRAATTKRIGQCPEITGTYLNEGVLHIEAGIPCSPTRRLEGAWSCDLSLAPNLGVELPARAVVVEQPDSESINVKLFDELGVLSNAQVLHHGKDYQCDEQSVQFSSSGSLVMLIAAIVHSTRAFARDQSGGLVMSVHENVTGNLVFFGIVRSSTSYVRWAPVTATQPALANPTAK